jgi:serine phosphatase RsbU (regulator of sigma subunit)
MMQKTFFERLIQFSTTDTEMFHHMPWRVRWQALLSLLSFYVAMLAFTYLTFDSVIRPFLPPLEVLAYFLLLLFFLSFYDMAMMMLPRWRRFGSKLFIASMTLNMAIGGLIGGRIGTVIKHAKQPVASPTLMALALWMAGVSSIGIGLRLYGKAGRALFMEKSRVETEIRLAHEIQRQLLPELDLSGSHFRACGSCTLAGEVGGDFFDAVAGDENSLTLAIGDVSGHDVAAGLLMAVMRALFRAELRHRAPGPEIYRALNTAIRENAPRTMFATLQLAQFDFNARRLAYFNAGHPPALHFRSGSRDIRELTATGMALGLDAEASIQGITIPFQAGDYFLFYTDGIIEARDMSGAEFGLEQLKRIFLDAASSRTLPEMLRFLQAHVDSFSTSPRQDDATLLLVSLAAIDPK